MIYMEKRTIVHRHELELHNEIQGAGMTNIIPLKTKPFICTREEKKKRTKRKELPEPCVAIYFKHKPRKF